MWDALEPLRTRNFSETLAVDAYNEICKVATFGPMSALLLIQLAACSGFIKPVYGLWGHIGSEESGTYKLLNVLTEDQREMGVDMTVAESNKELKSVTGKMRITNTNWEASNTEAIGCEGHRELFGVRKVDIIFRCKKTNKIMNFFKMVRYQKSLQIAYLKILYKGNWKKMDDIFHFLYQKSVVTEDTKTLSKTREDLLPSSWFINLAPLNKMPCDHWD